MESVYWSYFAAIIDGEGHLGETKNGLIITTTNPELAIWLRRKIGGRLRKIISKNKKHSNSYRWVLKCEELLKIGKFFIKFLKIKKENLLDWYEKKKVAIPQIQGKSDKDYPEPSPTQAENDAYLAGLIDGEGAVFIRVIKTNGKRGRQYLPVIVITNTDYRIMEWLIKNYGGRVNKRRWNNSNWKDCYSWWCGQELTRKLIKRIEKFAIVKKPHLKQLKKFFNLPRSNNPNYPSQGKVVQDGKWLTPHGYKRAEKIVKTISILNRKKSLLVSGEGAETFKGDGFIPKIKSKLLISN